MSPPLQTVSKRELRSWCIVLALILLLVVLGALQYRWTEEMGQAASTRMQADLQTAMSGFRKGLWSELGEVCTALHPATFGDPAVDVKEYSQRLLQWRGGARHPQLVDRIYLWAESTQPSQPLNMIDPSTGKVQQVGWPANYAILHQLLARESSALKADRNVLAGPSGLDDAGSQGKFIWAVDQHSPALLHPALRRVGGPAGQLQITWIIVQLNAQVLEGQILPELSRTAFGAAGLLDFKVAVLGNDNDHPRVVYSSDPGFGHNLPAAVDGESTLWKPSGFIVHPATSGPLTEPSPPGQQGADDGPILFLQFHYSPRDQGWKIVVDHRSGSIQEAIAQERQRDLAVSFGILLVLAGTMGVLVVNTNRARRLAQLQVDFVTGVTHELRTPLAVILSAAENIQDGTVSSRSQMLRYGLVIHRQAKQLLELVEQVLLFASTQETRQQSELSPVEVTTVLQAALEKVDTAGVTLALDIEPDLPLVSADFQALSRCLENLITNAIKYGGESKWLGIKASSSRAAGVSQVKITIEDRGIGIAKNEVAHIFDPFYRSPSVAASNIHGTGLGLPLARSTAEEMGGTITVSSEPGVGTSFTLHLPALREVHALSSDG